MSKRGKITQTEGLRSNSDAVEIEKEKTVREVAARFGQTKVEKREQERERLKVEKKAREREERSRKVTEKRKMFEMGEVRGSENRREVPTPIS